MVAALAAWSVYLAYGCRDAARQLELLEKARPPFADSDVKTLGIVLTYEAQVFPEPLKSQAFQAIAWTIRNRVATHYDGTVGYADEQHLLSKYKSFRDHRFDPPDPRALVIAKQVLTALTNADDETGGARHFVDNSFWTGTHDQTGSARRVPGRYSDWDIQVMADDGRFGLTVEWKSAPTHPKGLLFYGLYFFDNWPPPDPLERVVNHDSPNAQ
jgi:hypothetical protein